jgi:hypothetical protein
MAKANEPRGLRDEANVGPDPRQARNLIPMRELDRYQVAEGEPDIRGWPVFSSAGREVGLVEELLVDTTAGEVVMLDVDLRRNDRHTLAPIRAAWIDRTTERVVIDSSQLDAEDTLPTLPRRGAVSDDDVRTFDDRYQRAYGERGYAADREYRVRRESDELRFGRRGSDRGEGGVAGLPGAPGAAAAGTSGASSGSSGAASTPADRRTFDRERDDRDAGVDALPPGQAVEPDVLDAQTRAGIPAHAHGDRYIVPERVVERHPRGEDDAARAVGPLDDAADRRVRYPAGAPDPDAERRRRAFEEGLARRPEADPPERRP